MVRSSSRRRRAVRWAAGLAGLAGVLLVVAAVALGRSRAADAPPPAAAQTGTSDARSRPASGAVAAAVARNAAPAPLGVGGGTPPEPPASVAGDGTAINLATVEVPPVAPTPSSLPPQPFTPDAATARDARLAVGRPPSVACAGACFVRVLDDAWTRDLLARHGVRPTYAHGGRLWAMAPPAAIDEVRATVGPNAATVIVDRPVATLPLYVLRLPKDATSSDEALIRDAGEVVDQVDGQFIIRVPALPPPAMDLVEAGIWIEKLPPHPVARPTAPPLRPPLPDLSDLVGAVSADAMEQTILELTTMGADDPNAGSRYYASPGNVAAGEYLYTRLSALGLRVWYEDFITNDGYLALNVVGELPGRDPSAVYLVLAHYDSTTNGDIAAPGADDNATGVAGLLEIARVLAGYDLLHPVRFFGTNAEEVGLQGAREFGVRARQEEIPFDAAFNLDATGSPVHGTQLILNADADAAWIEDLLIRLNDEYGLGQDLQVYETPSIVADDNLLRANGIDTVLMAREMYGWSDTHHTMLDTTEMVDLDNVRTATQLALLAVGLLAGDE